MVAYEAPQNNETRSSHVVEDTRCVSEMSVAMLHNKVSNIHFLLFSPTTLSRHDLVFKATHGPNR